MIYDKNDKYYAGINFDEVDPLENWSYRLSIQSISIDETPKQLGQLMIGREKALVSKAIKENGGKWMPFMVFEIYDAKEYDLILQLSKETREQASCAPPLIGGDVIKIGKFVFINRNDCLEGYSSDGQHDYARPVVNAIFSKVDAAKATTLEELVKQFPIRKAK